MSSSKSLLSYADVQESMDKALASPRGIAITFDTRGQAVRFRHRAYSLRKILREKSAEVYPPGEFMHGRTVYDSLTFPDPEQIEGVPFVKLKIEKGSADNLTIEEL